MPLCPFPVVGLFGYVQPERDCEEAGSIEESRWALTSEGAADPE